jgi:lipoyl-dependent peroxiredoxin
MRRFGSAAWSGSLCEGKGSVVTESHALENYHLLQPLWRKAGTNPEELLGAAHAACFAMSFTRMLRMANFVPE